MDELISRKALYAALNYARLHNIGVREAVANVPAIDTERHARWEAVNEHCNHAAVFRCSGRDGCGASVDYGHYTRFCDYEWCPNCGARMDAEGEKDG